MNLKEKAKNLPLSPGVYLMKDSHGSIIYVGKAKNLKNRVQSYFRNTKHASPKVERLVANIRDFEIIHTDTEFEAFLLECKLIQELKPHYNRKMKNPLSYTYLKIQLDQEYYRIDTTSTVSESENSYYFGPYTSKSSVERAIQSIKEHYKINCSNPSKMDSACLNYSIGLCIGMCQGGAALEQYNNIVKKMICLLTSTDMSILEEMQLRMKTAAEEFDFETAAKVRDSIDLVNYLLNRKRVIEFTEANQNVAIIEPLSEGMLKLFLIKGNNVLLSDKLSLKSSSSQQLITVIKKNILTYFSAKAHGSTKLINRFEIDEAQIIYSYLKGSNCSYIIIPEEMLESEDPAYINNAIQMLLTNFKKMPSSV